jgi:hypothetical protein
MAPPDSKEPDSVVIDEDDNMTGTCICHVVDDKITGKQIGCANCTL